MPMLRCAIMVACAPLQCRAMPLKPLQIRHLRGLAHALKPVILVGAKGVSEAVLSELEIALAHHELVKIRLSIDDRGAREAGAMHLARVAQAELVQRVGKTVTLYRRNPDKQRITLPR